MNSKEYIYFRESAWQSFLSDLSTFGFLLGSFWVNYTFIGNNGFVSAILLIMLLMFIISKGSSKRYTFNSKEELMKYLENSR